MYKTRREQYFKMVQPQSISIFFSGKAPNKTLDQYYHFVVNRNFYYLSGIDQSNSVLVLIKGNNIEKVFLFIEKRDPIRVLWDGEVLSFKHASLISSIDEVNIFDIKSFDEVIHPFLTTSRRAVFGEIDAAYFDLDKNTKDQVTIASKYANQFNVNYPAIAIKQNQAILANLRQIKDESEVNYLKEAIHITKAGLERVMTTLKPGLTEYQVEAEYNYVLNHQHSSPSFDTIAAAGVNATVLHYVKNDSILKDGDLILLDLGALKGNYASDISRTYPVSGVFTKRQKEIYDIVLKANEETIKWLKPGRTIQEFHAYGKNILTQEAKRIGLIQDDHEIERYYYHSLGHYLGLDVHDLGDYSKVIQPGNIITVEPGLYIKEEGIGIRIEDDILITETGAINLSEDIIKSTQAIESFMKKR